MKLTGETITDEQIRAASLQACSIEDDVTFETALGDPIPGTNRMRSRRAVREARARAAEILNARNEAKP